MSLSSEHNETFFSANSIWGKYGPWSIQLNFADSHNRSIVAKIFSGIAFTFLLKTIFIDFVFLADSNRI